MRNKIDLAKKLKALSLRGEGGEAKNAAEMLKALCLKNGIDISLLEEDEQKERRFATSSAEQRTFTVQVIASVVGRRDLFTIKRQKNSPLIVHMTDAEFLETRMKIDYFWPDWLEQKEIFRAAYIQKQRLYTRESDQKRIGDEIQLSPEEIERIKKILSMTGAIEARPFRKLIES